MKRNGDSKVSHGYMTMVGLIDMYNCPRGGIRAIERKCTILHVVGLWSSRKNMCLVCYTEMELQRIKILPCIGNYRFYKYIYVYMFDSCKFMVLYERNIHKTKKKKCTINQLSMWWDWSNRLDLMSRNSYQ